MSACPHTDNADKCTCHPGCGCDTLAMPETSSEYEFAYSIFDNAPDDMPRVELRDKISAAIKKRRAEHQPDH
jgi:hypothetical protein